MENTLEVKVHFRISNTKIALDFDVNEIRCTKYFVTDGGCQIGVITQSVKSFLSPENYII